MKYSSGIQVFSSGIPVLFHSLQLRKTGTAFSPRYLELQTVVKLAVVLTMLLFSMPATANPALGWFRNNITLFQEASFDADYQIFALQKPEFKYKYNTEANLNIDIAFVGIREKLYWMFRSELHAGMSQSNMNVVLSPYDASYMICPSLEYRFKPFHVSAGLDHRCFHYLDQPPPEPIVYWNKIILSVNSPHRRKHPAAGYILSDEGWDGFGRFVWNLSWGYYLANFFGLVEPYKLMSLAGPHFLHDFRLTARYGIFRWKWGAVCLTGSSLLGSRNTAEGLYWGQETGAEVLLKMRTYDTSVFVNYILDDASRFNSKDRLLSIGVRIVK